MKIQKDVKLSIQCFVYYLFKGTLDPRLIPLGIDYLDKLLDQPALAYNCFEIFAFYSQQPGSKRPEAYVSDYILALHEIRKFEVKAINLDKVKAFNLNTYSYWHDFLKLSKRFCHTNFPITVEAFDFKELKGCGTDAVPYFAIWTNIVDINSAGVVTNSEYALKRANERLKLWDDKEGIESFNDTELQQEIY